MEANMEIDCFSYEKLGYHGHIRSRINNIVTTGVFPTSNRENEWLGTGVYFFEEDIKQAIDWCVKANAYNDWSVIEARIKADKMLDLDNTEHFNEFKKWVKVLRARYNKLQGNRKLTEKVIFDFLHKMIEYDVVRHTFNVPKCRDLWPTNIRRKQVQLCVRNPKCIIDFKEVDVNGC